ncbi:hypothetical protein CYMTET_40600 [Cymbomonas tetramitiformis]|uniref:Uncharacterized protein n=1 Tax=Cymbomonas tetramitiformis TaxID=36881 RepID=A0AAE0C7U9_9CHLO|nr:hypothetical protein CYMTET_40600 [Cymbomonas tetramitiformis]
MSIRAFAECHIAVEAAIHKANNINMRLHHAARHGETSKLEGMLLIDPVEAKDENGDTALHLACEFNHKSAVKILLAKGAPKDITDKYGRTPLHRAAEHASKDALWVLITANANVEANIVRGKSGAELYAEQQEAYGRKALHIACEYSHLEVMDILLETANIQAGNEMGETPLHIAARKGNEATYNFLVQKGADIEAQDLMGHTPLHTASETGKINIMQLLIDAKANVNATDTYHDTPLMLAAANGQEEAVELLISAGASAAKLDHKGRTLRQRASTFAQGNVVGLLDKLNL